MMQNALEKKKAWKGDREYWEGGIYVGSQGNNVLGWLKGILKDDNHVLSLCFYIALGWTTQEEERDYLSEDGILGMFHVKCWWGFNWTHEFGEQKMSIPEMWIWNWSACDKNYD